MRAFLISSALAAAFAATPAAAQGRCVTLPVSTPDAGASTPLVAIDPETAAVPAKLVPLAARLGHSIVKFHEDEQSLGGVITAVAVLVPDFLYNCQVVEYDRTTNLPRFKRPVPVDALDVDHPQYYNFTKEEYEFLSIVKTARLA